MTKFQITEEEESAKKVNYSYISRGEAIFQKENSLIEQYSVLLEDGSVLTEVFEIWNDYQLGLSKGSENLTVEELSVLKKKN